MPDIFYLVSKWWKHIFAIVVLSIAGAVVVLYIRPAKYLSVATALPASLYAADKASVFNQNIQLLYAATGTPDDLDAIVGTAQLDTVYIAMSGAADLADHYKVEEKGPAAILKAAHVLRGNTKVMKSEYNELKVKVWDRDKKFAAEMANSIMQKLQDIHSDVQNSKNISMVKTLRAGKEKLRAILDSMKLQQDPNDENRNNYESRREVLLNQEQQYEKLINEYELMVSSRAPVLIIIDRAREANWPDQPKKLPVLMAAFLLSLFFAVLLVLLLEKRNITPR